MGDPHDRGTTAATTWHHGLIARWWANFNLDGPEIAFFRSYVAAGQPALDVGCGSGRLLVPWVAGGLDVDGVDASADMIEACRGAARAAGCEPTLYVQPTHRLELPRRYRAIVNCGAFGLGGGRADDAEGLRRLRTHLLPGGVLALDYEVGEFDDERWHGWRSRPADETPPPPQARRLGPDGFRYALRHRITSVDVAERSLTREMQAWQWHGDELVAHEAHDLVVNVYSSDEIVALLVAAGFSDVRVLGGYHGGPPADLDAFHVFVATRVVGGNAEACLVEEDSSGVVVEVTYVGQAVRVTVARTMGPGAELRHRHIVGPETGASPSEPEEGAMSRLWTRHRSPESEATKADVSMPTEEFLPDGQFSTSWMKVGQVAMPGICCGCGQPTDPSRGMEVRNSDAMGKLYITVVVPMCDHCATVLADGGGGRAAAKRLEHSVRMKVKRVVGFADNEVRFVFTNRRFFEAFEETQRLRTALLEQVAAQQQAEVRASAEAAAAARKVAKEQRSAERAAKKMRHGRERSDSASR